MDLVRTLLFVPGNRGRMLVRAARSAADVVVVDLEDAVPPAEKREARRIVRDTLPKMTETGRPIFVRVNNVRSGLARDDLMGVLRPGLAGVVHPKTESAQDLRDLDVLLREAEMRYKVRPGDIKTIPLIESARGVLRCEEIALASDRAAGLSVGGEDYTGELGTARSAAAIAHLRQVVVTVAAAYGLVAIDTPFPDFKDEAGLIEEAKLARALGFRGKYLIHPDQVAAVNSVFTPSAGDIAEARAIIAAAKKGSASRRGAVAMNGRMIDAPVVARARRLVAAADAIAARALTPAAGAQALPARPARD